MKKEFVLTLMIIFGLTGCEYPKLLTPGEITSLVQEIIYNDTLYIDDLCPQAHMQEISEHLLLYFTPSDTAYFGKQNRRYKDFSWEGTNFRRWDWQRNRYKPVEVKCDCETPMDGIGLPLITADRKRVVFYVESIIGPLGGHGVQYIYRKTESGKWIKDQETIQWISNAKCESPRQLNPYHRSPALFAFN